MVVVGNQRKDQSCDDQGHVVARRRAVAMVSGSFLASHSSRLPWIPRPKCRPTACDHRRTTPRRTTTTTATRRRTDRRTDRTTTTTTRRCRRATD